MSAKRRPPLPPFANQIEPADDLVMVYCGPKAWKLAAPSDGRVASIAYPRGEDPSRYRWPVHSKHVLVLACGEPQRPVDLLVIELLRQGAHTVFAKYNEGPMLVQYNNPGRERHRNG